MHNSSGEMLFSAVNENKSRILLFFIHIVNLWYCIVSTICVQKCGVWRMYNLLVVQYTINTKQCNAYVAYGLLIKTLLAFEFIIYIIVYVQKPQFLLRYCFNSITSLTFFLIIPLYPLFLCCSKKGLNIINNELRLRRLTNLNNLKML